MVRTKQTVYFGLMFCAAAIAGAALGWRLYARSLDSDSAAPQVSVTHETSPSDNQATSVSAQPPATSGNQAVVQENTHKFNIERLAKKYGTTPEEHKAYVEKLKEKQKDKATHDLVLLRH
jgi:hypothetical protein